MDYGSGDFTFECWLYPLASNGDRYIVSDYTSAGQMASASFHVLLDDGILKSYVRAGGVNIIGGLNGSTTVQLNVWHHVALVRNGNVFTLYLNGASEATTTLSGAMNVSTQPFTIGRAGNYVGLYTQGYIADARLVKGTAVYTSAFTPPTAPLTAITNTEVLTCTNKNDIWDAGSGNLLTKTGNATSSNTQRKFNTSSAMYFDGTGDYLSTGYNDLLALGTGDFTVECWVNKSDTNHRGIWQIGSASGGLDVNFATTLGFVWRNSPSEWQIYAGGTNVDGSSSFALSTNTWYHAAVVRSSGTTKLYINGTEEISTSDTQNYTGTYMAIGGAYTTSYLHNGYIQDVRVTKGLARYTANFTPPTSEFGG